MKKNFGLKKELEMDVPSKLDAVVLAYASIRRQRLSRWRKSCRAILACAAAICCCTAVLFGMRNQEAATSAPSRQPVKPDMAAKAGLSTDELLALSDFTAFEQETFATASALNTSMVQSDPSVETFI